MAIKVTYQNPLWEVPSHARGGLQCAKLPTSASSTYSPELSVTEEGSEFDIRSSQERSAAYDLDFSRLRLITSDLCPVVPFLYAIVGTLFKY